jgi:ABC-2 type transport system ATP-binding protein
MAEEPPQHVGHDVTFAVRETHGVIVEAVRKLGDAGIDVEDLALRRPTLDDVFLALTGHAASEDEEDGEGLDVSETQERAA